MSWNRKLWAVEFTSSKHDNKLLLGSLWHGHKLNPYPGEPTHVLLFTTRKAAREWCKNKQAQFAGRNDCCAIWRFRPVRVREMVRKT